MSVEATYLDIGTMEYKAAWELQEEKHEALFSRKKEGKTSNHCGTLIFCEHPHVYTLGKSGEQNNLLINDDFLKKIDATYYRSNRGGDITYHGPGQIVGYPIFDLEILKLGVKDYIHNMEEAIIQTLAEYNIVGNRLDGATGVWIDVNTPNARKICAIGVRVSRAITMHGFALNVATDLKYFSYINPCGFVDKGVTSMAKELETIPDIEEVKLLLKLKFAQVFSLKVS